MAWLIRPLMQWPRFHHHCCYRATLYNFLSSFPLSTTTKETTSICLPLTPPPSSRRNVHHRSRGLRQPNAPPPSDSQEDDESASDSDSDAKKSRNQKKREARQAVRWGMQLATFSPPQIKRILRVASLDEDVLDAIMLVKRLGPDVREGKRRQFNYIGKLLREGEVEAELIEALIQATKVGDSSTLQALARSKTRNTEDDDEESIETEDEEEDVDSHEYINVATRWYDGLINKDVKITNEIYSVQSVDFDRQELRKLVKSVVTIQESQTMAEGNELEVDKTLIRARKSLARFLRTIAKQMSSTYNTESHHSSSSLYL